MKGKEEHIAILCMLAKVSGMDGQVDESEKLLIRAIAMKLGVDEHTTEEIISGRIKAKIKPPPGEFDRIPYFQMCVMASGVNGEFNDEETLYCKKLGLKLGLRDQTLDKAIALFKEYHPRTVPAEVLKRTFQIDHN